MGYRSGKASLVSGMFENSLLERRALVVGWKMLESTSPDIDSLKFYLDALLRLELVMTAEDSCRFNRLNHLAYTSKCARDSPKKFFGGVQLAGNAMKSLLTAFDAKELADGLPPSPERIPSCCEANSDQIDWDYLLGKINQRYDLAREIHAMGSTTVRLKAIRGVTEEVNARKLSFADRSEYDAALKKDRDQATRQLTDDVDSVLNEMINMEQSST